MIRVLAIVCTGVVAGLLLAPLLRTNPRGSLAGGVLYRLLRGYVRGVHRLAVGGRENIPPGRRPGPLIVVANHTAGVDPLLIQAACPFEIRWLMGADMGLWWLTPLWRYLRVIFMRPGRRSGEAIRQAVAHLRAGGVVGIFPEGGLERPPRTILPFGAGVGILARRSGAPILCVVITGTPTAPTAWGSLWRPSRARLVFHPLFSPPPGAEARWIADELRARYLAWTGWPANDQPQAAPGVKVWGPCAGAGRRAGGGESRGRAR